MAKTRVKVADAPAEWVKAFVVSGIALDANGEFEYDDYNGDEAPSIDLGHIGEKGAFCLFYAGGVGIICYVK